MSSKIRFKTRDKICNRYFSTVDGRVQVHCRIYLRQVIKENRHNHSKSCSRLLMLYDRLIDLNIKEPVHYKIFPKQGTKETKYKILSHCSKQLKGLGQDIDPLINEPVLYRRYQILVTLESRHKHKFHNHCSKPWKVLDLAYIPITLAINSLLSLVQYQVR